MGTEMLCNINEWSHLPTEKRNYCFYAGFSDYCACYTFLSVLHNDYLWQHWWHWTKFPKSTWQSQPTYGQNRPLHIPNTIIAIPSKESDRKSWVNHDFLYLHCCDLHNPRISHMHLEKVQINIISDVSLVPLYPDSKWLRNQTLWYFCRSCEHSQFKNYSGIFYISGHISNHVKGYRDNWTSHTFKYCWCVED